MKILGERMAQRRSELDLSQEALAEMIDSTQRQVSKYENGVNNPTSEVLIRIADALQTSLDWLMGRTDISERPLRGQGDLSQIEKEAVLALREKTLEQQLRVIEIIKLTR